MCGILARHGKIPDSDFSIHKHRINASGWYFAHMMPWNLPIAVDMQNRFSGEMVKSPLQGISQWSERCPTPGHYRAGIAPA